MTTFRIENNMVFCDSERTCRAVMFDKSGLCKIMGAPLKDGQSSVCRFTPDTDEIESAKLYYKCGNILLSQTTQKST